MLADFPYFLQAKAKKTMQSEVTMRGSQAVNGNNAVHEEGTAIYILLLMPGYLCIANTEIREMNLPQNLNIPNKEIIEVYRYEIFEEMIKSSSPVSQYKIVH